MYNFLTTFNTGAKEQRWSEFLFCLSQNLDNPLIDQIFIALEAGDFNTTDKSSNQQQQKRLNYLFNLSENVTVHNISCRPTFEELFTFCNNRKPSKWIISNADIYFPKSNVDKLELLAKRDYDRECFVLTRYNILNEMKIKRDGIDISYDGLDLRTMHGKNKSEGDSIDSWIFESPFDFSKVNFDIQLGQPECDGMMNYQLSKIRKATNPCLSVISIHKHSGWYPWYKNVNFNGLDMTRKEYNKLMAQNGHQTKSVKFSKLPQDDQPQP